MSASKLFRRSSLVPVALAVLAVPLAVSLSVPASLHRHPNHPYPNHPYPNHPYANHRHPNHRHPNHRLNVQVVNTAFSVSLTNLSAGALGGTEQQVVLTLTPSNPSASYQVGTVTISESPTACNPGTTDQLPAAGASAGPVTLPAAVVAISYSPPCGQAIDISYSGGSYRSGGTVSVLRPDTWTVQPNEGTGTVETSQSATSQSAWRS